MKRSVFLMIEIAIAALHLWLGLTGISFLWIQGPRSAAITLGVIGVIMGAIGSWGSMMNHPHAASNVMGTVIEVLLLLTLFVQVFGWENFPLLGDPVIALVVLAAGLVVKGIFEMMAEKIA